ncbi:MAG: hypothetical protein HY391_06205 [Deltaproteobacteria bacterium]|nr:hypothetical protein [Deltaproteobacteria bacterium]
MAKSIRAILIGIGEIGQKLLHHIPSAGEIKLAGAVDIHPNLIGKPLSDISGHPDHRKVLIRSTLEEALKDQPVDVAILTTSSRLDLIIPTIEQCLEHSLNVVTAAEELAYPWRLHPEEARRIDIAAQEFHKTVLSAGINPGLLMDALPSWLMSWTIDVRRVTVRRVVDVSQRRSNLKKKAGCGLTIKEFKALVREQKIGHVGLLESLHWIADRLGWDLSQIREEILPIPSDRDEDLVVGSAHTCKGTVKTGQSIELELVFQDGAKPIDRIELRGTPSIDLEFPHGVDGDLATVASLVNGALLVSDGPKGLTTLAAQSLPPALRPRFL